MTKASPERPHALAGLIEKRAELAGMLKYHHAEIRKVTCDLDHVDAAIRLFDPNADVSRVIRYPIRADLTRLSSCRRSPPHRAMFLLSLDAARPIGKNWSNWSR